MPAQLLMSRRAMVVASLFVALCTSSSVLAQNASGSPRPPATLMTPRELDDQPSRAPDRRIAYGADISQYGELRVPTGRGPHPVVVLIHGGCFKAAYATSKYFGAMGDTLKTGGIVRGWAFPACA